WRAAPSSAADRSERVRHRTRDGSRSASRDRRHALGRRRLLAAAGDANLAVDEDRGDAGEVALAERVERIAGDRALDPVEQYDVGGPSDFQDSLPEAVSVGDVAGGHGDGDLRWNVGDRREIGDLAQ